MGDGTTAQARLERLLHVLPAASREGGASLAALAQDLGTTRQRILDDLNEATERIYYHPGGWPDDLRIRYDAERVRVVHAQGFDRPVRLNPRELLCLALALRGGSAAEHLPADGRREALLERAEAHLAWAGDEALAVPPVAAPDRAPDPEAIRETILAATRARTPVGIMYAKAGAEDADLRVIHPYRAAYADGHWYALGHCTVSEAVRVFRIDRILEAAPAEGSFEVPEDFDPAPFFGDGSVYHAGGHEEAVRVRYSPTIARWVRERAEFRSAAVEEDGEDGIVLRHQVADPRWVVSHALQYGAEAEILGPPRMRALVRALVREVVEEMAG